MSDPRTDQRELNRQQLARTLLAGATIAKAELLPVENGTVITLTDGSYFEIEDRYHPTTDGAYFTMPHSFFPVVSYQNRNFAELYGGKPGDPPPRRSAEFNNLKELMKAFSKIQPPDAGIGDAVSRSTVGILDNLKLAEAIEPKGLEPGEQAVDFRQPENVRRWWASRPEGEDVDPLITTATHQQNFRDFLDTVQVGDDGKAKIVPVPARVTGKSDTGPLATVTAAELGKLLGKSEKVIKRHLFGPPDKHAYHQGEIPKGKTGYFSKIWEEVHEAKDAHEQGNTVMLLVELADTLGAIECFLEKNIPGVKLEDIVRQAQATNAVFRAGGRPNRDPETDPGV